MRHEADFTLVPRDAVVSRQDVFGIQVTGQLSGRGHRMKEGGLVALPGIEPGFED